MLVRVSGKNRGTVINISKVQPVFSSLKVWISAFEPLNLMIFIVC